MNKLLNTFVLLFLLNSCAFNSKKEESFAPSVTGIYYHDVTVEFPNKKKIQFKGINKVTRSELKIVAIGDLGNTIFNYSLNKKMGSRDYYYNEKILPVKKFQFLKMMDLFTHWYETGFMNCKLEVCNEKIGPLDLSYHFKEKARPNLIIIKEKSGLNIKVKLSRYEKG